MSNILTKLKENNEVITFSSKIVTPVSWKC
jgi:hypothetical protein